jgi:adenylate cyclase
MVSHAGSYPLPRRMVAQIIRGLTALKPAAIALDIAFLDAGDPQADRDLADALGTGPTVVAAIGMFERDGAGDTRLVSSDLALAPAPANLFPPTPQIAAATRSGLVNVATDMSGVPRFIPMIFRVGDNVTPSLALAAASIASMADPVFAQNTLRLGETTTLLDFGYHLPIRFYGPRGAIKSFSALRVMQGALGPAEVSGKVVVIGATAMGLGDSFATPFDRIVPGVEIVATGVANLLAGDGLIRTTQVRAVDAATSIALPVLTVLLMAMRRNFAGLWAVGVLLVLWIVVVFAAFLHGYWLSVAVPLAALIPILIGYGALRLGLDRYLATQLASQTATLARFQSPLLVEQLLRNSKFLEKPVHQQIAVLFVDLSGFTGVAEELGPDLARDLIRDFQRLVEQEATAHEGYVTAFMGDGVMIIFGVPQARPDDAFRALMAMTRLETSIASWLEQLPPGAARRLSARIGGHYGPAVVSRLGAEHHQHISAIGDTVNVASRLMEVAKQHGRHVVVSDDLCTTGGMAPDPSSATFEVDIRGREQTLIVRAWG